MSLNPAQRAAVDHRGGPLLVLAGAGTGKTRVITHRVVALLDEGVPPWRILAVTFTNKAATEMRERIERLCEGRPAETHDASQIWIGTFHSIGARILRRYGEAVGLSRRFSIYDTGDQAQVMTRVLKELDISDRLFSPRGILTHIDRAKNRGLGPNDLDQLDLIEPVRTVVRKAYARYQELLAAADAVDFGDLLLHTVKLLQGASSKPNPEQQLAEFDPVARLKTQFVQVVVDEFQDTNPVQADLIDGLASNAELCVVGDDDQAIYGWRGADVAQILRFPDRHPGTNVIRLEQNYRSTGTILRCADGIISKNRGRLGKTLWSELGEGDPVRICVMETEREEARYIGAKVNEALDDGAEPDEIAVFYRTHALSRVLEDELRRSGLSCRIIGGVAFYDRAEVKDVLSYMAVLDNPHSDVHLQRIINRPTRGIGATTQTKLAEFAASAFAEGAETAGISLWAALQRASEVGLSKAALSKVEGFVTLIKDLREEQDTLPLDALLARVIEVTNYRESLVLEDTDESRARLENLEELHGNVIEFVEQRPKATLDEYLELVSLLGGERAEGDKNRAVTLMTVHSAKGLEFEHVFLTGMEERVFPHSRVIDEPEQMEEERRLAYVAVTRAKRHLTLTMTTRRRLYGQVQVGTPSRFVQDLPREACERIDMTARASMSTQRPAAKWQDDVVYDASFSDDVVADAIMADAGHTDGDGVSIYVGMVVRHSQFGEGEVLGWEGGGAKLKLQLRFPGHGKKTILARFCEPL